MPFVELSNFQPNLPLRLLVTHHPPRAATLIKEAKYIYVARNPWDVCVSSFHMIRSIKNYNFENGKFEDFVNCFLAGDLGHGSYFDHLIPGYGVRNEPNVLFITYEELSADTRATVLKIARFLGDSYADELKSDERLLQLLLDRSNANYARAVLLVDFSKLLDTNWMRAIRRIQGFSDGISREKTTLGLVRKGKVGSWKELFTPELLQNMEATISEVEKKSDVMKLWISIRDEAIKMIEKPS
ncbi:hypothetical protein HPB49_002793 [Dermacentor silvarum]|uniref:Uncharacterized protein n=1 Tax=Dermacentor silvarum TaxID=543639 RepID=A0ACB8CPF7_DERSI|nr:hypothetical protein HPB49_002793 [Dermacentor silvarum]